MWMVSCHEMRRFHVCSLQWQPIWVHRHRRTCLWLTAVVLAVSWRDDSARSGQKFNTSSSTVSKIFAEINLSAKQSSRTLPLSTTTLICDASTSSGNEALRSVRNSLMFNAPQMVLTVILITWAAVKISLIDWLIDRLIYWSIDPSIHWPQNVTITIVSKQVKWLYGA